MQIRINPRDWAHIPVWLWPLIWWQLMRLRAHVRKTGQDGFYQIMHDGRVDIYLAPDRSDLNVWLHQQRQSYLDHWTPMHVTSGEAHLYAIRYWTPRFMECGERILYISWGKDFSPAPAIEDSS